MVLVGTEPATRESTEPWQSLASKDATQRIGRFFVELRLVDFELEPVASKDATATPKPKM